MTDQPPEIFINHFLQNRRKKSRKYLCNTKIIQIVNITSARSLGVLENVSRQHKNCSLQITPTGVIKSCLMKPEVDGEMETSEMRR